MKKKIGILSVILGIVVFIAATSCVVNGEKDEITAPTIRLVDNAVSISFNSLSGMTYANIFRQSCNDSSFEVINETVNIGQVHPVLPTFLPNSFNFIDEYLQSTLYYRYFIRYYRDNYYAYTGYSPGIQLSSRSITGVGEAELTYIPDEETGEVYYINNLLDKEYYLELNTDVEVPHIDEAIDSTDFTNLYFVISNGTVIKPYVFAEADEYHQISTGAKTNDLRIFLLRNFLGMTNYVQGLIAVKKTNNEGTLPTQLYNSYYWTKLKPIQILERKIQKPEDKDGDIPASRTLDNSIYVPPLEDNTNEFDYNLSTKMVAPTMRLEAEDGTVLDLTPFVQ